MRIPFIQKNPVTMAGDLDHCWLFAYRTPVADARQILPLVLEPVTRDGFAFWNVVVSHIHKMRPKGVPAIAGMSYWHVAYRLYARFQPPGRAPVEGLYFTRSDCDSTLMTRAGNLMTDFNFHTAQVRVSDDGGRLQLAVQSPDAGASATLSRETSPRLMDGSPFGSLDEAASFLKYKPFGISVDSARGQANIVRIKRQEDAWRSKLLHVKQHDWQYFAGKDVQLELCYEVEPIFYTWTRGRIFDID